MQLAVNAGNFVADVVNDRRSSEQPPDRVIGRVIGCDGSRATILSTVSIGNWLASDAWSIGKLVSINLGRTRIVAVSVVESMELRDAILSSGMEVGLNEGFEKLDDLLAQGADGG